MVGVVAKLVSGKWERGGWVREWLGGWVGEWVDDGVEGTFAARLSEDERDERANEDDR